MEVALPTRPGGRGGPDLRIQLHHLLWDCTPGRHQEETSGLFRQIRCGETGKASNALPGINAKKTSHSVDGYGEFIEIRSKTGASENRLVIQRQRDHCKGEAFAEVIEGHISVRVVYRQFRGVDIGTNILW